MRYVSLVVDILFTCSYAGNSFTTWQDFFLHNYGNIWKHRIWILDNFDILIDIDFCENNITENVKWLWVYLVSSARAFFYDSIWWNWALYLYLRPSVRLGVKTFPHIWPSSPESLDKFKPNAAQRIYRWKVPLFILISHNIYTMPCRYILVPLIYYKL